MTSVFIVRPFEKKTVTVKDKDNKDVSVEVDFDAIDNALTQEALTANGLVGQTTGVIAQAGNIRLDMFQMLIAYDLVIADVSVENANVFYELGIRHGLRPNGTILIRFADAKEIPFDLRTDRYIVYDRNDPGKSVALLTQSIKDTIAAGRTPDRRPDSPVFLLLPALLATNPAKLIAVPRDFRERVESAEQDNKDGPATLARLADEAKRNVWSCEGVRLVGRAQRRIKSSARESWEFIRNGLPDDIEASLQLATIYQRLGDYVSASQACQHVLGNAAAGPKERADARSQLARNTKALWVADFSKIPQEPARRAQAIADQRLAEACDGYMAGFAEDLNDYYSEINALGLLTAIVQLAEREPASWASRFETQKKADAALDEYRELLAFVCGAVWLSLENARLRAERSGQRDEWLPPSQAQYSLLTADKAAFIENAYRTAKNSGTSGFSVESEAAQVRIFQLLGLFPDYCRAALTALGAPTAAPADPPVGST